jgi:hypothetical protein
MNHSTIQDHSTKMVEFSDGVSGRSALVRFCPYAGASAAWARRQLLEDGSGNIASAKRA